MNKVEFDYYGKGRFLVRHCFETVGLFGFLKEWYYALTCSAYRECEQEVIDFNLNRSSKCKRRGCPVRKCMQKR